MSILGGPPGEFRAWLVRAGFRVPSTFRENSERIPGKFRASIPNGWNRPCKTWQAHRLIDTEHHRAKVPLHNGTDPKLTLFAVEKLFLLPDFAGKFSFSYRYRLEGIFCKKCSAPLVSLISVTKKIIRTGDSSPIRIFRADPLAVREFRFRYAMSTGHFLHSSPPLYGPASKSLRRPPSHSPHWTVLLQDCQMGRAVRQAPWMRHFYLPFTYCGGGTVSKKINSNFRMVGTVRAATLQKCGSENFLRFSLPKVSWNLAWNFGEIFRATFSRVWVCNGKFHQNFTPKTVWQMENFT